MWDWSTLLLFLTAAGAIIVMPGPDIFFVLAHGLGGGRRAGVISGLGVASGDIIHTVLATFGLAAMLAASPTALLVIKYLGVVYLLFLGFQAFRNKNSLTLLGKLAPASSIGVYWQSTFRSLLNSQAVLFFVVLLPQFVNPIAGNVQLQLLILGLIFALCDILVLCTLAYFTGCLHTWLTRKPQAVIRLQSVTGITLIGLSVHLAIT